MSDELQQIAQAKSDLSAGEQTQFELLYGRRRKDPNIALILGILFGGLGVDRFYIGDIGLGFAKLFTLGGLVVWTIIDWFLIRGAARTKNAEAIQAVSASVIAARPPA